MNYCAAEPERGWFRARAARGVPFWLLGIPIPIIILLAIFWHHQRHAREIVEAPIRGFRFEQQIPHRAHGLPFDLNKPASCQLGVTAGHDRCERFVVINR
jgi:hypothetical protein